MLLVMIWWCKHVLKTVDVDCWRLCEHMHCCCWVICSCIHDCWWQILYPCWWRIFCIQLFGLKYYMQLASWGDDLGVDLVPHASRRVYNIACIYYLKSRVINEYVTWRIVLCDIWWMLSLCDIWWIVHLVIFGEYVKMCTCRCLLLMVILVHLMILIDDVYFGENNEV